MSKKFEAIVKIKGENLRRGYKIIGTSIEEIEEKVKSLNFKNPVNWDRFKAKK